MNELPAAANRKDASWTYAQKPTHWTIFLRTFLPWQVWRFIWINWKMLGTIHRSHHAM